MTTPERHAAEAAIKRILNGYPQRAETYRKRACAMERKGDVVKARKLRAMAEQIDTNYARGHL